MQILYLDDSGKIHPNDPSKVAVFAGFTVDENNWHRLVRQITGAKVKFFPTRKPHEWEFKSTDFLTPDDWNRAKRRKFCLELVEILGRNGCRVYSLSLEKAKAIDPLEEEKFVPLMLSRLVGKFNKQLEDTNQTGSVVCDWSTHQMDHHITRCVSAMAVVGAMDRLRGGVTYGSSAALPPLQLADIIASTFRRHAEGQPHIAPLASALRQLQYSSGSPGDMLYGMSIWSVGKLF